MRKSSILVIYYDNDTISAYLITTSPSHTGTVLKFKMRRPKHLSCNQCYVVAYGLLVFLYNNLVEILMQLYTLARLPIKYQ